MFIAMGFGDRNDDEPRFALSATSAEDARNELSTQISENADEDSEQLVRILVFDSNQAVIHELEDAWGADWKLVKS